MAAAGVEHEIDSGHLVVDGRTWQIVTLAHPTLAEISSRSSASTFVVADRLSAPVRAALDAAGAGWLDRRGALHLPRRPDITVPPLIATPDRVPEPLTSAGLDIALALLADPARPSGVRHVARSTGRTPGRVSEILAALRNEGLVLPDGRPLVPELFWEVASRWRPRWKPLARIPDPAPHLRVSGSLVAAAYGAPMIATADQPIEIFVESERALRAVIGRQLDEQGRSDQAGPAPAYVARCPSPGAVTTDLLRGPLVVRGFATVHPVVAALDLSTDRARGREILDGWHPQEITRVW